LRVFLRKIEAFFSRKVFFIWCKGKKEFFHFLCIFERIHSAFFYCVMITLHAKNFSLYDTDEEKIRGKVDKLLHLCGDMRDESTNIRVEFERVHKHSIRGTLTISLPGDTLRAESETEKNVVSVMDELEDEIRPQIEKHKNKHRQHRK
jgi:ribosome-associated translation inhibitor RaiA